MTFSKMNDSRAMVDFTDGKKRFRAYLPKDATISNLAGVLAAIAPKDAFDAAGGAGLAMADLISAVSPAVRARLVELYPAEANPQHDFWFEVGITNTWAPIVRVWPINNLGQKGVSVFDGSLPDFRKWATSATGLENIIQKVVRFKYSGGSKPGKFRTIRVEAVEKEGNTVKIGGYDLAKEDLKMAYRHYLSDKIEGEIEVINDDE
jgi:hypothetical protein